MTVGYYGWPASLIPPDTQHKSLPSFQAWFFSLNIFPLFCYAILPTVITSLLIFLFFSTLGLHICWAIESSYKSQLEWFLCPVFMTQACRRESLVPNKARHILPKLVKGDLKEFKSICNKNSNGAVALEKIMNISHFKCPLLKVKHLSAPKKYHLLCTFYPLHQDFISFQHFPL